MIIFIAVLLPLAKTFGLWSATISYSDYKFKRLKNSKRHYIDDTMWTI